jgi:hypothetical protein
MSFQKYAACFAVLLGIAPGKVRADFWEENGCILAKPSPVLRRSGFHLNEVIGLATESVILDQNTVLRLEQTTCEYLSRTYTFILKDIQAKTNITGWQYRKAIELLSLLERRSTPKLKFTNEKKALTSYSQLVSLPQEAVDINIRQPFSQFYDLISVSTHISEDEARIIVKTWSGPY